MARGGRRSSPSASRSRAPPSRAPAQRASSSTPAPMQAPQKSGGMMSGIGSTIAQGMAFGTGSAMAHQAVGAIAGSFSGGGEAAPAPQAGAPVMDHQQQQQLQGACGEDKTMFFECLQINKGDQQACSFLYDNLQQCQRQSSSMQFN